MFTSDPRPYCEPLGKKSRNIGEDVMLWQGNDPRVSSCQWTINAYRTGKCASLVMKSITLTFSLISNLFLLRQWAIQANFVPSRVFQAHIINDCVDWLCYSICVIFNIIEKNRLYYFKTVPLKTPLQQNCKGQIHKRRRCSVFMSLVLTFPADTIMKFPLPYVEWPIMIIIKKNRWPFFPSSPLLDVISPGLYI